MTVVATDLGICGALLEGDERCTGRLIVERELGVLLEATCDSCGVAAARPVSRAVEPEAQDEPWWNK